MFIEVMVEGHPSLVTLNTHSIESIEPSQVGSSESCGITLNSGRCYTVLCSYGKFIEFVKSNVGTFRTFKSLTGGV